MRRDAALDFLAKNLIQLVVFDGHKIKKIHDNYDPLPMDDSQNRLFFTHVCYAL